MLWLVAVACGGASEPDDVSAEIRIALPEGTSPTVSLSPGRDRILLWKSPDIREHDN